ncbi:MAG TPA: flagellar hook-length control protein [Thermoanaerobaculia bacterium]|nr:flagellar hook-length control protein [Thermoanaerobaculia bacterium]
MTPRWFKNLLVAALLLFVSTLPASASGGFGMTWAKAAHDASNGTDHVACSSCNPYTGDTACSNSLPVLCFKSDGSPVPAGITPDFYNGWKGGHIATTLPILGSSLTSLAVANQICVNYFGAGYQIAEFHHSLGGWSWWTYGDVRNDVRFWTYISDQPGNCWN